MAINQTLESRRGSKTNWRILSGDLAVRQCDLSFFKHKGMAIPVDNRWFFGVEDMIPGGRRDITLYYDGRPYDAHFIMSEEHNKIRLFWELDLKAKFRIFQGIEPAPSVILKRRPEDEWTFEIAIGSEIQKYVDRSTWLLPWDSHEERKIARLEESPLLYWDREGALDEFQVNDVVYLYQKNPRDAITHRCVVNDTGREENGNQDIPVLELQCLRSYPDVDGLRLEGLRTHGLALDPNRPLRLTDPLTAHLRDMDAWQDQEDLSSGGNALFREAERNRRVWTGLDRKAAHTFSEKGLRQFLRERPDLREKDRRGAPSPYAAEYALRGAAGVCPLCGTAFPQPDGPDLAWLDCLALDPLPGGSGLPATIPVCPNCRRKQEIQNDPAVRTLLWNKAHSVPFLV